MTDMVHGFEWWTGNWGQILCVGMTVGSLLFAAMVSVIVRLYEK